ncbi:MAG: hypothetical protein ACLFS9_04960 [Nitriliruptoraceae bacterium]
MRCPSCFDEYEPHVRRCATCGNELVPDEELRREDGTLPEPVEPEHVQLDQTMRHLGRFHPAVAPHVLALLESKGIATVQRLGDDEVAISVPGSWRDDNRAELLLRWDELLAALDADQAPDVLGTGGHTPGWRDAPLGGAIDRDGRLIVDAPDDEEDRGRTLGPATVIGGAILALSGWQIIDAPGLIVAGIAVMIVGLLLPR